MPNVDKAHYDSWNLWPLDVDVVCNKNNEYNVPCGPARHCVTPLKYDHVFGGASPWDEYYWCSEMNAVSTTMHITPIAH